MAYVIAEPCIDVKDTACVDACPVDCIHPKKDRRAILQKTLNCTSIRLSVLIAVHVCRCARYGRSSRLTMMIVPQIGRNTLEKNARYFGR